MKSSTFLGLDTHAQRPQTWKDVEDPKERKRIQNRLAQRTYRDRKRQRIERLESLLENHFSVSSMNDGDLLLDSVQATTNHTTLQRRPAIPRTSQPVALPLTASSSVVNHDRSGNDSEHDTGTSDGSYSAPFIGFDIEAFDAEGDTDWSRSLTNSEPSSVPYLPNRGCSRDEVTHNNEGSGDGEDGYTRDSNSPMELSTAQSTSSRGAEAHRGKTGLHLASEHGRAECVRLLLRSNINVAAQDANGSTALHLAISRGHQEVVREICAVIKKKHGQHQSAVTQENYSASTIISDTQQTSETLFGLADVLNIADGAGNTALHLAVSTNQTESLAMMLEADPGILDLDVKNAQGWTALHLASALGHSHIMEMLLDNAADLNAQVGSR